MKNLDLTKECYQQAIKILKNNSTKFGILASGKSHRAKSRNYLSIFGRDASICSLGMSLSEDKELVISAKNSLETLARYQAKNGQIPFFVKPEKKQADFYYLGCIDATLWWLIAIKFFDKNTHFKLSKKLNQPIKAAINWLKCQEHPHFYLLQQNENSDWADLMPRSGFVLYSNALWYWVKTLYKLDNQDKTKEYFNYVFSAGDKLPASIVKYHPRLLKFLDKINIKRQTPNYLSFVNYYYQGEEGDVFANILACLLGLADNKKSRSIVDYLFAQQANKPYPIKAILRPINRQDKLWRPAMNHLDLNKPHQYHNGGVWPFVGGFWVMLLAALDRENAQQELVNLATINKKGNWQFNEWFNGQDGRAMGMRAQSWNAATYILAYHSIN